MNSLPLYSYENIGAASVDWCRVIDKSVPSEDVRSPQGGFTNAMADRAKDARVSSLVAVMIRPDSKITSWIRVFMSSTDRHLAIEQL